MQIYILMGVSGVGKTSLGLALASRLNIPFYDGDDFHPPSNIAKMEKGIPLDDEDRKEWLDILGNKISDWATNDGAILACSALKEKYRRQLQRGTQAQVIWIFLHETYEVIMGRIKERTGHFFKPELLKSQFETLEPPTYGVHVRVNESIEKTVESIMEIIQKPHIGLVGLGVMGKSLALNLGSRKIPVSVYNREVKGVEENVAQRFSKEHSKVASISGFNDLKEFVGSLPMPRNIFLMVKAGRIVDSIIEELLPLLSKDDLIIDGGNSHYKDTARRIEFLKGKGILFLGTGISGGEEGALKGPSIMPGGSRKAYDRVGVALEEIAAKDKNDKPCCNYIGPDGAGHFIKMVHNGIEYGEMQLIAEFYHFMKFHLNKEIDEIANLFSEWNRTLQSYLLEITIDILHKKEGDDLLLDKILDAAGQKGTGGWSTEAALELGVSLDTITAAVLARNISGKKRERIEAEQIYAELSKNNYENNLTNDELFEAYKAASIINHSIGFELLQAASEEYGWNLDLSEISRIWTNGCIIKSSLMENLVEIFRENPHQNLLIAPEIVKQMKELKPSLNKVISVAFHLSCPLQVCTAAANHLMSFTSAQSSANMIQAQRDYFGAHQYERVDKPRGEFFHTNWKKST